MSIDFKGYKYAVVTIQGGVLRLTDSASKARKMLIKLDKAHTVISDPDYKEDKQMDSIYTQEMFDKGEECEVGMMFQDSSGCKYVKLLESDSEGFTVIKNKNQEYSIFCQSGIKPIDTRTDREKAIDKFFCDVFNLSENEFDDKEFVENIKRAFDAGVTFTENKNDPRNETK